MIKKLLYFGIFISVFYLMQCSANPFYGVGERGYEDKEGPTIAIVNPVDGQAVSGTMTVVGTAVDKHEVASVKYGIDTTDTSQFKDASFDGKVFTFEVDTVNLSEASHTLNVTASDNLGNDTPVQTVNFIVDRDIPVLSISSPAAGSYNNAWLSYYNGTSWRTIKVPQETGMNAVYGKYGGIGFKSDGTITYGFIDGANVLWVAEYKK